MFCLIHILFNTFDTALLRQWLRTLRAGASTGLFKLKTIINCCIQHVHTLPLKYYTLRHINRPVPCANIKHREYKKGRPTMKNILTRHKQ